MLNRAKIHTGHNQFTRKGVPQIVPAEIFYTSFFNGFLEPLPGRLQPLAVAIPKDCGTIVSVLLCSDQCCERRVVQRNVTLLAVLRLRDRQNPLLQVNITPSEAILFPLSKSGIEG